MRNAIGRTKKLEPIDHAREPIPYEARHLVANLSARLERYRTLTKRRGEAAYDVPGATHLVAAAACSSRQALIGSPHDRSYTTYRRTEWLVVPESVSAPA